VCTWRDKKIMTCFFALGDFGSPTPQIREVASAMNIYATKTKPDFILGLGDNFYPSGVLSVEDNKFQSHWASIFLDYESLRVPWKIILGNHDYMGVPDAQIEFTSSVHNPGGLWQMPSPYYLFNDEANLATFFGIDTNAAQGHVQKSHPSIGQLMKTQKDWLVASLASSTSRWKIVYGHHAMYTKGNGHGSVARCLKDPTYTFSAYNRDTMSRESVVSEGLGLEALLVEGGAALYISGHEHIFQHHQANGIQHIISGSCLGENRFYQGENMSAEMNWVDREQRNGFTAYHITEDTLTINFVNHHAEVFETIVILHPRLCLPPPLAII
jgi:tartrate-resistant acid phosphatase type 5